MTKDDKPSKPAVMQITKALGSSPQTMSSVLRAWKDGRIGAGNAMTYLVSRFLSKNEAKGGAIRKSHGGPVHKTGHGTTYKRPK